MTLPLETQIREIAAKFVGGSIRFTLDNNRRTMADGVISEIRVEDGRLVVVERIRSLSDDYGARWRNVSPEIIRISLEFVSVGDGNIDVTDDPRFYRFVLSPPR